MKRLIVLFLHLSFAFAAISKDEQVKNSSGGLVFSILDQHLIQIPNLNREKQPSLKFALHGAQAESVEAKSGNNGWNVKLSDKSTADLVVLKDSVNATLDYSFSWNGGGPNGPTREVCFMFGHNQASWFNAYQSSHTHWPMELNREVALQQFNYLFDYNRFGTNDESRESIFILEHLYVNSDGFALLVDQNSPLFIRRTGNTSESASLCFSVASTKPYKFDEKIPANLDIKFRLFSSANIRKVLDYVIHDSGLIPKPGPEIPPENQFRDPFYFTYEMSSVVNDDKTTTAFSGDLESHKFAANGSSLVLHGWWGRALDDATKSDHFPQDSLISTMKTKGVDIGVQIYDPDVIRTTQNRMYCMQNNSFLDFTNPETCKFFGDKLVTLNSKKGVSLVLLSGATDIHGHYELHDHGAQKYPSILTKKYVETTAKAAPNLVAISEYAFKNQDLGHAWFRLTTYNTLTFAQLVQNQLIPNALAVSIAGYSNIIPYSIGGFRYDQPSDELFVRWTQAITFMPGMSFTKTPWSLSAKMVDIVRKHVNLHAEHAQTMTDLAKNRAKTGQPVIRPLWYVAPDEVATYRVSDQYMLGEDILVAPVLAEHATERQVYFPKGIWVDQHGKEWTGPGSLKVPAPVEELPYFKRKH